MNILHIGLMVNGRDEGLSHAFRKRADKYAEFKLTKRLPIDLETMTFTPELIFLQIQNDKIDGVDCTTLLEPSLNGLRKRGSFVINWDGDIRNELARWKISFARCCDITAFANGS